MKNINRICIIGAGNMGGAIAGGIFGNPDFRKGNLVVTAKTAGTLERMKASYPGIEVSSDNAGAVSGADLVIIAVKPWQIAGVMEEIRPVMDYGACTIASVVAGISFAELTEMSRKGDDLPALLRIIPNTAIALKKSTTFIASYRVSEAVRNEVDELFGLMGEVISVPEEMMAAGTSLASCGIAYALKYMDAAIRGGEKIGFGQDDARRIVMNTMKGALSLLEANGTMPQTEIDKVTTPGGYTFKGLTAMEECGFSEAVLQGLLKSM